jgi:hypothetical protein
MLLAGYDYWIDVGIANDIWVGCGAVSCDWLLQFILKLGKINEDKNSVDVCRIVERLFMNNATFQFRINDIFGSIGMTKPSTKQTDFLLAEATALGPEYVSKLLKFRQAAEKMKEKKTKTKNEQLVLKLHLHLHTLIVLLASLSLIVLPLDTFLSYVHFSEKLFVYTNRDRERETRDQYNNHYRAT